MSNLDRMLGATTPENLAGDPILRKAFIVGLMASDIFVPIEGSEAQQAEAGGVSLIAIVVEGLPHAVLFSSKDKLAEFTGTGTRFAKVTGNALFPSLLGQNAILNPGPSGLRLTPEDIEEINGRTPNATAQPQEGCGVQGHVHGPNCQH